VTREYGPGAESPEHPVWSVSLKDLRTRAGISQRLAAQIARVRPETIRRWEAGEEVAPRDYQMMLVGVAGR
jgi:DNA-binding XRE family transcriptional regulator